MTLSPEDRDRIYEEERARNEAQAQLKEEQVQAAKAVTRRNARRLGLATLGVLGVALVVGLMSAPNDGKDRVARTIHATVQFNGTHFIITNQDSFDWTNTELIVNLGMRSVSTVKVGMLSAGQAYTITANQFVDSDLARFNPLTHKPKTLSIVCTTPSGQAAWSGGWN